MNGKIVTVEKLTFCDDFKVEKSPEVEEFVNLDHIEEELRNISILLLLMMMSRRLPLKLLNLKLLA